MAHSRGWLSPVRQEVVIAPKEVAVEKERSICYGRCVGVDDRALK